jgi:chemotaxis protein methyltransferase CheR
MFSRHFKVSQSEVYELDAQLKRNMKFMPHNLMERPRSSSSQDIVFLRNVLIYFRGPEQMQILKQVAAAMPLGAILILGESESLSALEVPFTFVQPQIYRKSA